MSVICSIPAFRLASRVVSPVFWQVGYLVGGRVLGWEMGISVSGRVFGVHVSNRISSSSLIESGWLAAVHTATLALSTRRPADHWP